MHAGQQEGSAEQFLLNECGIEESKVDGIITAAVAWRVTPGGRQLIDRRRRSRIERNMLQCAEYLIKECSIEPGRFQAHARFSCLQKHWNKVAFELLSVLCVGMLACQQHAQSGKLQLQRCVCTGMAADIKLHCAIVVRLQLDDVTCLLHVSFTNMNASVLRHHSRGEGSAHGNATSPG